jgi:hypothetical protein
MKKQEKILKAIQLLKDNNIEELEVCNFGTYRQYELAGEFISIYILDDCDLEEDLYEELSNLLDFIDEKYIKKLGFWKNGQNTLILTQEGFKTGTFTI